LRYWPRCNMRRRNDNPAILHYPLSWRSWRFRLVLALLILIAVVRVVWGWQAARLLRESVDRLHQHGEVAEIADLKFQALPPVENAWIVQLKAAVAIIPGVDSPRSSNDTYRDYPPYPSYWMKRAAASEKVHQPVFSLLRQARALPHANIRSGFGSPAIMGVFTPSLNQVRHLANIAGDGALYAHVSGDDAEAIDRTLDVMHLAASLRGDPMIVSQLVATGIDALAMDNLQVIAPGLRIDRTEIAHSATRPQIRSIIAQLLDEEPIWQGTRAAISGEHAISIDLIQWRASPAVAIKPMADMEQVRAQRWFEKAIIAADARNYSDANAMISRAPIERPANQSMYIGQSAKPAVLRYSRWYLAWEDGLSRYLRTTFRLIAERRMTAVSLAAQLYRADQGHWPADLEDLVPAYLPAIPLDPFRRDSRTVGYNLIKGVLPGGGDRPVIYCEEVGAIDQGPLNEPMYGWQQAGTAAIRQYRDLARFEPLKTPSTQTINSNPQKSDAPGK
jgi:hypothetical protein